MFKAKHIGHFGDCEKEFLKLFDKLVYSRNAWQVWEDLMTAVACSISNAADRTPNRFKRREEQYKRAIENLGGLEIPSQIFAVIIMAFEINPEQDFLGKMYMNLNLGDHWKGQFFTPYNVCKMMAEISCTNFDKQIEEQGYISVCEETVTDMIQSTYLVAA